MSHTKVHHQKSEILHFITVIHTLLLWLIVICLGIYVIKFKRRRFTQNISKYFYFSCFFAFFSIIISILYLLLFNYNPIRNEEISWITLIGALSWIIVLLYCIQYTRISQNILAFIIFILFLIEWINVGILFISPTVDNNNYYNYNMFYILFNLSLALSHTNAYIFLLSWDWLMVNEISTLLHWNPLNESNKNNINNNNNNININDSFYFSTIPLSHDFHLNASEEIINENNINKNNEFHFSIIKIFIKHWGITYIMLAFIRFLFDIGSLLPAYLLRELVDNLSQEYSDKNKKNKSLNHSIIIISLIIICSIFVTFLRIHYNMKLQKISLYNRKILTKKLFHSSLYRRKYQFKNKSQGDIMNHLTIDIQRVSDIVQTLNDLWALPLQLIFALYLLYTQVSFAFIAGVMITLFLIPVNMFLAKRIKNVQIGLMKENDERVLTITEIINNITYIKMCGWSPLALQWLQTPRKRYMRYLYWLKYLDAFCVFFWAVTPILVSLFTFITFISFGGNLTPGKAITALSLFASLILPLNAYPWVINGMMEAYVSWNRLQSYFIIFDNNNNNNNININKKRNINDNIYRHPIYVMNWDNIDLSFIYSKNEKEEEIKEEEELEMIRIGGNDICKRVEIQPLLKEERIIYGNHDQHHLELFSYHNHNNKKNYNEQSIKNNDILIEINEGKINLEIPNNNNNNNNNNREEINFSLFIPNFKAIRGQLIAIVGKSGSGKSTFLNGIIGELLLTSHYSILMKKYLSIAYVEQYPFLIAGTLRENILFGLPYDAKRYETIIKAVALEEEIKNQFYPENDLFYIGDRGKKLSGGQKVRVVLARALYAEKDLYLIDDILGSLDTSVAHHILIECIIGTVKKGKCVIFVTHNEEFIKYADNVYICNEGEMNIINQVINNLTLSASSSSSASSSLYIKQENNNNNNNNKLKWCNNEKENIIHNEEKEKKEEELTVFSSSIEISERGTISLKIIYFYINRIGWGLTFLILISVIAMQFSRNSSDQYIVVWSKNADKSDTKLFLRILSLLAIINSILALSRGFSFAIGGLRAAERIHDELILNILSSTFIFFSNTPPGRIINRLSNDIYTIDESLPFITNILIAQLFLLIGNLIIIIMNSTLFIILILIPIGFIYHYIQYPYRYISRELRRLESASRAPLLDTLRDILDGGIIIRSLGKNTIESHLQRAQDNFNILLRTQYNALLLNVWFSLRLELIGVLILIIVGIIAIYYHGTSQASLLGLSLAYVQPLTSYVNGVLSAFTSTEKEFISVERVQQYFNLENEESSDIYLNNNNNNNNIKWPNLGKINFKNVSLRYDIESPQVLQHLTFHVNAGEKVAIVGRTGAGKSSIFNALLRLVKLEEGDISIDENNIYSLPLEILRTRLGVLPQQPFIFHGTLRNNIDPFNLYSDKEIISILQCVQINNINLDFKITNTSNISVGQKHQIALARVLLQRSPILLLDEPTSQSSLEVESSLWQTLKTYFKNSTILCITHKLTYIDFFDRIIVIEKGQVVNSGSPAALRKDGAWPFL